MKAQEAIEILKGMQSPSQDYADMVGAPAWAYGCRYVYPEPEDYAIEEAITALEEKAEPKMDPGIGAAAGRTKILSCNNRKKYRGA